MTAINDDDLKSLAAKLEGLDLTDPERAALDGVIDHAGAYEPDVEGFGTSYSYSGTAQSGANLSGMSLKLGGGLGFVTRPDLGYGGSRFGSKTDAPATGPTVRDQQFVINSS